MANKPLQSIQFPGLPDKYTVPQMDSNFDGVSGKVPDSSKVKADISSLREDLNAIHSQVNPLFDRLQLLIGGANLIGNNNSAIVNNNDGSYTVGTTDYGVTVFGADTTMVTLTPGDYYLYGVPNGIAFLSTTYTASTAYRNRVFENANEQQKLYHVDNEISVYVGFISLSKPSTAYTIYPALYKYVPINPALYTPNPISLNGNYFDADTANWQDGWYKPVTAIIEASETLQYAYCPIIGAGSYTAVIQRNVFGSNAKYIALVDASFAQRKYTTGTQDGNNISFSIEETDTKICKYFVIVRDKTKAFVPKLFYNSTARGGIYPLTPNYGYISDPLYKKIIVCDGDSICFGYKDEPKQYGSWFGRLQNDYQVSGHNYAVSGATITDMRPSVSHSVALNIDTIYSEYSTLDYLILEGGTNDSDRIGNFVGDTPPEGFGTWSDDSASDYNGGYDNTTFCGAVDELFYKAVTYYPNAKIGFIIPMQMGTYTTSSKRRRRYFDEIVKIANKWHVNVLDLWNICHADARIPVYYSGTEGDLTKFYYDGQHPTSVGYDLMQPVIEAWLKTL